ncbi:unnamed protein product [Notodromas monacha]|uniref:Folliculin n=1 Tax=Notodromas monacha TaxID=399045 RepID=A0A7R9GAX9_9CRUS|nr:unnamed protein product [Notodromas monacha]CAG0915735.1 unnamed protein product [Notodromas monacha]
MSARKRSARNAAVSVPEKTSKSSTPGKSDARGVAELMRLLEDGDRITCNLLKAESDLILECKVCKSLFRNVMNFSSHKRNFCMEKFGGKSLKRKGTGAGATPAKIKPKPNAARRSDDLSRELEDAMLQMGEGSEEERDPEYLDDEEDIAEEEYDAKPALKTRPWSTPKSGDQSKLSSDVNGKKMSAMKAVEAVGDGTNKCKHCGKVFVNRAGTVSHERYCATLTMPLLGRGLAFHEDFNADLPVKEDQISNSSPVGNDGKKVVEGQMSTPLKQIVALPKGAIVRSAEGQQTFIVTTINGQQRAIPVRPAAGPPGTKAVVKVSTPGASGSPVAVGTTSTSASKPETPVEKPEPKEPTKPAQQAPIPNSLQPDLVKLLKEFSGITGTVLFTLPELVKLNGDPQSGPRLKELISCLPPAGLIASKPISSGVLTKIVLSRPGDKEDGALKVVVIESGYSSQGRVKSRVTELQSSLSDEEPEEKDMKEPQQLFNDGSSGEDEEEDEDEEEKMRRSKMLLPPPKPVLRKMDLKMDKLMQSAVSKHGKKKQISRETDAEGANTAEVEDGIDESVKGKLKSETSDVTFKEMFAMPEAGDDGADEDDRTKSALILVPEEQEDPDSNVRRRFKNSPCVRPSFTRLCSSLKMPLSQLSNPMRIFVTHYPLDLSDEMNVSIGLCHFCEVHGPSVVACTRAFKSRPTEHRQNDACESCAACSPVFIGEDSRAVNGFVTHDEETGVWFLTSGSGVSDVSVSNDQTFWSLLRCACVRSLSCEFHPTTEDGRHSREGIYFGDPERGHTLSFTFSLKDSKARGFKRSFSIIVFSYDRAYLMTSWKWFSAGVERFVNFAAISANNVFDNDQAQECERAARLERRCLLPDSHFRSIVSITGMNDIFHKFHENVVWTLKTADARFQQVAIRPPMDSSNRNAALPVYANLQPCVELVRGWCKVPEANVERLLEAVVTGRSPVILFCAGGSEDASCRVLALGELRSTQLSNRIKVVPVSDLTVESEDLKELDIIGVTCARSCFPGQLSSRLHWLSSNRLGEWSEIGNDEDTVVAFQDRHLHDKPSEYVSKFYKAVRNESLSIELLSSLLLAMKQKTVIKARSYAAIKAVQPGWSDQRILSTLSIPNCDAKLIQHWAKGFL